MPAIVGIPVYKARKTLPAALDSLVTQTSKSFFVVLSVDGDGENYDDIVEEYQRRGLAIRALYSETNGGPGAARQKIIDASGDMFDYITFLDADDMFYPRTVEVLHRAAIENNADVVVGKFTLGYGKGQTGGEIQNGTRTHITWMHGKMYKLKYLKDKNIRFLPDVRLNEDSYFNAVACFSTKNLYFLEESVYLWQCQPGSLTRELEPGLWYMKKSYVTFIKSQIRALLDRYERTGGEMVGEAAVAVLAQIYNTCAMQLEMGWNDYSYLPDMLHLQHFPPLQEALATKDGFKYFLDKIDKYTMDGDKIIYYTLNPIQWVKEFVKGNMYEWEEFL